MVAVDAVPKAAATEERRRRERATIVFPYGDLNDAVDLATTVASHFGTQCSLDQLAAKLGHQNIASGGFRLKISTARTFGVIDAERGQGPIVLTELGRRMVQPSLAAQARVTAFLAVPLYRALYEKYKGFALPRDTALEHELVQLGVPEKQKDKARHALIRSADQAGLFAFGRERLVLPVGLSESPSGVTLVSSQDSATATEVAAVEEHPQPVTTISQPTKFYGGGLPFDTHPFIVGLFQTLPTPGMAWPSDKREQWLSTARLIFGLIFSDPDEIAPTNLNRHLGGTGADPARSS